MKKRTIAYKRYLKGLERRFRLANLVLFEIIKYGAAIVYVKLFNVAKDPIWMISERGTDARDNSYHLFKYIRENHPNIDVRYVISCESVDAEKVRKLGRVVKYRSFDHYVLMCISSIKISTHIMGFSPSIDAFSIFDKWGILNGKKVFLQHGVTKDNHTGLYYPKVKLDLFVCSAEPEFQSIIENYGYPKGAVKLLGLPRFDNLDIVKPSKIILIMPTWRVWLNNFSSEDEFMNSDYFQTYTHLLNNESLHKMLERINYEVVFYPHYEMQKYINLFYSNNDRVKIASFLQNDVQELLNKSTLLITDYSSVFFDFAYMRKPIIYYQFDYQKFTNNHYEKGYFDYNTNGFGTVVQAEDNLLEEIRKILIENKGNINDEYLSRTNKFFTLRDRSNSKRVFDAIVDLEYTGV